MYVFSTLVSMRKYYKMVKLKNNKRMFSTLAMLMVLSFVVSMFAAVDIANAQTVDTERPSYPFVFMNPSKAGVGQPVAINFGLTNNLARDGDGWNVTLRITDPDGKVETIKRKTWSTGYTMYRYTPSKEGNYTLQCIFDKVVYNPTTAALRGTYRASESEEVILEVSTQWKDPYPGHNLPTEYWTRPIDGQLREWAVISGSWVSKSLNRYSPYNQAPLSSHVLWTAPCGDTLGGLTGGGNWESVSSGDAYEGRWTSPTILAGVLYYNKYQSGLPTQAVVAMDVRTGEVLWEKTFNFGTGRIATGQVLTWDSMNSHGTWEYLWIGSRNSNTLYAVDAATGNLVFNITNVPAGLMGAYGRFFYGDRGELLKYQYNVSATGVGRFVQWNQSVVCVAGSATDNDPSWGSAVRGRTFDSYARGYDINVSIPDLGIFGNLITVFPGDKAIFGSTGNQPGNGNITLSAISLKPGSVGTVLYKNVVWDAPESFLDILGESYRQSDWAAFSEENQVMTYWQSSSRSLYTFDTTTGRFMWETDPQIIANAWYSGSAYIEEGCYNFNVIVYDKLISASIGGVVYCYDINTGNELWNYPATDLHTESYISENWWLDIPIVACNEQAGVRIVYIGTQEHSVIEPKPRGAPFIALDVETGDVVWSITGMFRQTQWGGTAIIGDSVIVTQDTYNQQIYAIGKGPSEVTVSMSNGIVTAGSAVLVTGTVMDIAPGVQSDKIGYRFPKGVAAVSDESMNSWMRYVYKDFDRPYDVQGVEVTLFATDGTQQVELGKTVTDDSGRFSITWKNTIEGDFDVYAYFDGTNSYYGSWAKTEVAVLEAPEVPPDNTPAYEWYIVGMGIAIIAVFIIGLWLTRKK